MSTEVEVIENKTALSVVLDKKILEVMGKQRNLLATFCKEQLKAEVDFGVIPGTQKQSLWKPGAEKIANIFQLGSKILMTEKDIDFKANLATYTVTVEVFHLPTGRTISQCMAVCTSQEKKYRTRKNVEWIAGKKNETVIDTPIGDVLNTLVKMAIKRAYVGAVIMATGSSDFFTMDIDEYYENDEMPPVANNPHEPPRQAAPPVVEKERAKFENKAHVDAEAKGAFDKFAGGAAVKQGPTERELLGKEMNTEYKRLKWNAVQFSSFVMENFGKTPAQLDIGELGLLVETLRRMQK